MQTGDGSNPCGNVRRRLMHQRMEQRELFVSSRAVVGIVVVAAARMKMDWRLACGLGLEQIDEFCLTRIETSIPTVDAAAAVVAVAEPAVEVGVGFAPVGTVGLWPLAVVVAAAVAVERAVAVLPAEPAVSW